MNRTLFLFSICACLFVGCATPVNTRLPAHPESAQLEQDARTVVVRIVDAESTPDTTPARTCSKTRSSKKACACSTHQTALPPRYLD